LREGGRQREAEKERDRGRTLGGTFVHFSTSKRERKREGEKKRK